VLLVTSGAVGCGRSKLHKQMLLSSSFRAALRRHPAEALVPSGQGSKRYDSACAAAGQLALMALYETLFSNCDIEASQFLVTGLDFTDEDRRANLQYAMGKILELGMVPIINENDAVSANKGYTPDNVFSDNDSLGALVAQLMGAQVLVLLTDVEGLYDAPPSSPGAKLISTYHADRSNFKIGEKSAQGRGGMGAKVDSALRALDFGISAIIMASGHVPGIIEKIFGGEDVGTLFTPQPDESEELADAKAPQVVAQTVARAAREASHALVALTSADRSRLLAELATALETRSEEVLRANERDLQHARAANVDDAQMDCLKLTRAKLSALAAGVRQLAEVDTDPLGRLLEVRAHPPVHPCVCVCVCVCVWTANLADSQNTADAHPSLRRSRASFSAGTASRRHDVAFGAERRELSPGLILEKRSAQLGVLFVIVEALPDALPQMAALALRAGSAVLLKAGSEAHHSNTALHAIVTDTVQRATSGIVPREIITLVSNRAEATALLTHGGDGLIDLVVPCGSKALVEEVKSAAQGVPVLGRAAGVCHVYVDAAADVTKAISIVVDSKTTDPGALNDAETILFHRATLSPSADDAETESVATRVLAALSARGVQVWGGPVAIAAGLASASAATRELSRGYGGLSVTVEVVDDIDAAIGHIHQHGSKLTECIVTEDGAVAERFLSCVDASCVFRNSSSRFADAFRFGLGPEIGMSTGK
jgi:delta-1-pyrroline-5-carboxylate synthetase